MKNILTILILVLTISGCAAPATGSWFVGTSPMRNTDAFTGVSELEWQPQCSYQGSTSTSYLGSICTSFYFKGTDGYLILENRSNRAEPIRRVLFQIENDTGFYEFDGRFVSERMYAHRISQRILIPMNTDMKEFVKQAGFSEFIRVRFEGPRYYNEHIISMRSKVGDQWRKATNSMQTPNNGTPVWKERK